MTVSYIFAMDRNRAIGLGNQLPWRLPADLAFFKRVTSGHPILMGRKTFDSIGNKPLPKRENIILTQNREFAAEGCIVMHTVEEAVKAYKDDDLFVIGGTEVFRLFMPVVDKMYITLIEHEFEADTYFPDIDMSNWKLESSERGVKDEKNPYDYSFNVYVRIR